MKAQEIKKLHQATVKELDEQLDKLQKDLVIKTQELRLGRQTNLKIAKNIKKDIAVIKTIKTERERREQTKEQ